MSSPILGQVQGDFLKVVVQLSKLGVIKCVAFNHRGTLLAAGFSVGSCVIWDFQTKKIAHVLRNKKHTFPTTSLCWSKNDRFLLVSDINRSLILWDAVDGNIIARTTLQHIPMKVELHPGSTSWSICLACPLSSPPLIVNLKTGSTIMLPIALSDGRNKSGGFIPVTPTASCFNNCGDLVYVGNFKGEILVINHKSVNIQAIIPVTGGAMIKNIAFSRNGKYLHTNSSDGIIRIYKNLLPIKDALLALNDETCGQAAKAKNLKAIGSRCLDLLQEIPTEVHWKASCVSHDGKFVAGVSACRYCKICVWDNAGHCMKVIDGPNEMLIDITWHPVYPMVVAVSRTGSVYTWGNDHTEAFSPKLQLQGLEEAQSEERGDEFDSTPETEIAGSQSGSPHLKKADKDDVLKNCASCSLEEVGRRTYLRRKEMVSEPIPDNVMMPPPSNSNFKAQVGEKIYVRRKKMVSKADTENVIMPPPSNSNCKYSAEVGRITYMRRKKMVSQPDTDDVMMPPPST